MKKKSKKSYPNITINEDKASRRFLCEIQWKKPADQISYLQADETFYARTQAAAREEVKKRIKQRKKGLLYFISESKKEIKNINDDIVSYDDELTALSYMEKKIKTVFM